MEALSVLDEACALWRCAWCGVMRAESGDSACDSAGDSITDGICEGCLARELTALASVRASDPELLSGLRLRKRRRRAA